jgi:hypothetical protein
MKKRVLVVLALLGTLLPVGGIFQAVSAGTGSANSCSDGQTNLQQFEYTVIASPITLAVEIPLGPDYWGNTWRQHVRLCYSTSPTGYGDDPGEGDIAGGSIEVAYVPDYYPDSYGDTVQANCTPQGNPSALAPSCSSSSQGITCANGMCAGASPGTSTIGQNEYGWTVTIPLTVCVVACTTISPTVGPTGWLHVQGGPTGAPSGTSTGAGVSGVQLTYCSTTTGCVPLAGPLDLSAGVAVGSNPTNVTTGVWNGSDAGPAGTDIGGTATVGTPSATACANGTCPTVSSVVAPTVGAGANTPWGTYGCIDLVVGCMQGVRYVEPIAAVQVGSTVIPVSHPICIDGLPPRTDGTCHGPT